MASERPGLPGTLRQSAGTPTVTEYRRGLIRVSLAAVLRRGRLLAAKVAVIGAVGFVTGLIAAVLAVAVGTGTL